MAEELVCERTRMSNRIRGLLSRCYPQLLEVTGNVTEAWVTDLWRMAPTKAAGQRLRRSRFTRLFKRHRIRRIYAAAILQILRRPAIKVAPGTAAAAVAGLGLICRRLELVNAQPGQVHVQIDRLSEDIAGA